jgi:hypothetical protein
MKPISQPAHLTTTSRRTFLKGLGVLGAGPLFSSGSAFADPEPNPNRNQIPLDGTFGTTFEFIPTSTPGVFDDPIEGVGHIRELGFCLIAVEQTADFRTNPSATLSSTWVMTFVAGDQLNVSFQGTGTPDSTDPAFATLSGSGVITGGTGRFVDATGEVRALGFAHVDTPPGIFPAEGHATFGLEGLVRLRRD